MNRGWIWMLDCSFYEWITELTNKIILPLMNSLVRLSERNAWLALTVIGNKRKTNQRISQLFNSLPTNHINQAIWHLNSDYHVSRGFFLAWLLAFVKSFAWLVSHVVGLFVNMDNRKSFNFYHVWFVDVPRETKTNQLLDWKAMWTNL